MTEAAQEDTTGMPTPGPWFVEKGDHPADVRIQAPVHDPEWRGAAKPSKLIAVVGNAQKPWTDHVEEWEANAALIVKAVNAYDSTDALRSALAKISQFTAVANEANWKDVILYINQIVDEAPTVTPRKARSGPYEEGWNAYVSGGVMDGTKSPDWKDGWKDAQSVGATSNFAMKHDFFSSSPAPSTSPMEIEMTEAQIKHMVDRFLAWKLPKTFSPDGGISFERIAGADGPHPFANEPSGTNLLCATEATEMVRHMLEGLPGGSPAPSTEGLREALAELLHAVCGETGFAEAVRRDAGHAYPWPALDIAEEKARTALAGVTAPQAGSTD